MPEQPSRVARTAQIVKERIDRTAKIMADMHKPPPGRVKLSERQEKELWDQEHPDMPEPAEAQLWDQIFAEDPDLFMSWLKASHGATDLHAAFKAWIHDDEKAAEIATQIRDMRFPHRKKILAGSGILNPVKLGEYANRLSSRGPTDPHDHPELDQANPAASEMSQSGTVAPDRGATDLRKELGGIAGAGRPPGVEGMGDLTRIGQLSGRIQREQGNGQGGY